ncbi:MAG: ABC transporter substrate-binding protein [Janthinobacterium lividum]
MSRNVGRTVRAMLCLGALCLAKAGSAQPIRLMTGGAAKQIYLPVILAERLGYFSREGLDVRVLSAPTGIDTSTELVAGAIQGAVGFYDHTIVLQSRGMDVQSVIVLGRSAGLIELARRDSGMKTMADVRGRRLGVTGFGSSTFHLTRFLATQAGVPADAYVIVPLATEEAFEKAIADKRIDAGMIEEPTATRVLSANKAHVLADLRTATGSQAQLGGPYAGACLYMQRAWIDRHPGEIAHLVRAVLDALRFIDAHSAQEIAAVLPASIKGDDPVRYQQALSMTKSTFSVTGRMPVDAPSTVLAVIASVDVDVSVTHIDIARTYTNRFVTEALADASASAGKPRR